SSFKAPAQANSSWATEPPESVASKDSTYPRTCPRRGGGNALMSSSRVFESLLIGGFRLLRTNDQTSQLALSFGWYHKAFYEAGLCQSALSPTWCTEGPWPHWSR